MGPQEAKEFFTEHLEKRRRSYDDRKLTPGGEGFMGYIIRIRSKLETKSKIIL